MDSWVSLRAFFRLIWGAFSHGVVPVLHEKKRNLLKISTNIKAHVRVTGAEPCTRFWEQFLNLDFENSDSLFSVHIRSKSFDFVWIKLKRVCTSISMTKYIVAWNVASFKNFEPWTILWWFLFFIRTRLNYANFDYNCTFWKKKNKMQESCRSIKRKLHMTKGDYSVTELIVHSKILLPVQNTWHYYL